MSTTAIHFVMDQLYVKPFKEKLSSGKFETGNVFSKENIDTFSFSRGVLILQAHYWPLLKQKRVDEGMILLVGKLNRFYSWIEAASYNPTAYCCTLDSMPELEQSLKSIQEGLDFFSKKIILWLKQDRRQQQETIFNIQLLKHLTPSELSVLFLIGSGKSSCQIANIHHCSVHTIKTHRKNKIGKKCFSFFLCNSKP